MTHFIFATRGIYASMQQMISDLNAQRFWWERTNLTKGHPNEGKVEHIPVQGILRPIQLWEYVYPKESPTIIGQINCPKTDNTQLILRSLDISGPEHYIPRTIDWAVNLIRNKLGLKKIPEIIKSGPQRAIHLIGISIIPIGIKDDEYRVHDFGAAGTYKQEGL